MLKTLGWKGFRDHFATIIFMEKDLFFVLSRVWDKEKIQSPHEESNLRPSDIHGGRNVISFVLSCHRSKICQKDSPHQNVFKLTLSQKSFYVFRKDRQCKFIFLLSPSLDLINIISVGSRCNESSRQNLAEKPAYFAGCRLLSSNLHYQSRRVVNVHLWI